MTSDLIQKRLIERSLKLAEVRQKSELKRAAQTGLKAYGQGLVVEAEAALKKVLEIDPDQPDALQLKALMALDRKDYTSALPLFARAVSLKSDFPLAFYNQGNAYRETNQLEEAVKSYMTVIDQAPDFADAYGNLGLTYLQLSDDEKAFEYLNRAVEIKPDYPVALNNLGNLFRRQGKLNEAAALYNKSIIYEPGYALGYSNLGNVLRDLGKIDQAISAFEKAQAADPLFPEASYNLGLAQLLTGDFLSGWEGYQHRHKIPGGPPSTDHFPQPLWDGTSFAGKTLYLYPEQGLGDVIQFSRYVPLAAEKGGSVILRTPPKLKDLFESLSGVDAINLESEPEPESYDVHASLMDLPRLFKTNQDTIPDTCPYLEVDQTHIKRWSEILGAKTDFRVGLVWAGRAQHENDHNRSIDPELFIPLSRCDGISLFSLQIGKAGQAATIFGNAVKDLAPHIKSWTDTAAAMKNLDLIISVDTSSAHMAGAIGCDVWTLLPFVPDWRWQLERSDSPWYPTMRLFRQSELGDWAPVLKDVLDALMERI